MAQLTNQQQGEALGVGARYVQQLRERGLPKPGAREPKAKWLVRAKAWIAENTAPKSGKSGDPNDPTSQAHYERRAIVARAHLQELQLQKLRGEVHSKAECYAETVQRLAALQPSFARLCIEWSRTLAHKDAAFILEHTQRGVREAFEGLAALARQLELQQHVDAPVLGRDGGGAPVAGADVAERVGRSVPSARQRKR